MKHKALPLLLLSVLAFDGAHGASAPLPRVIAEGMEVVTLEARTPSPVGDRKITVVRMDPKVWELDVASREKGDHAGRTAREWAAARGFAVAINAGMFAQDHTSHLGYLQVKGEARTGGINAYQSVAAFDPIGPSPAFQMFDLDAADVSMESIRRSYRSVVQNLRLIRKPGANRWGPQRKRWSAAALGEDKDGNILFVFSRSPFTMRQFNAELLGAGLGVVALQHLEGGPEAQLYLKVGKTEIEAVGSYETDFLEDDSNQRSWPIPHVLGVRLRLTDERN